MKVYHIKKQQVLPISLDEAWDFFSSPKNLAKITPAHMNFRITNISGDGAEMYSGQIICYRLNILPGISTFWMTEITHVKEPYFFIDEQRFGPYALWNHQHQFKEVSGGIEMTDELYYAIPFGWLGRLVNRIFVEKEIKKIFDYRTEVLEILFQSKMVVNKTA